MFGAGIGIAGADAFCEDDCAADCAPADVDCQQDCCEDTCKLNADTLREQGELNCEIVETNCVLICQGGTPAP